jgi:hypothetical protein
VCQTLKDIAKHAKELLYGRTVTISCRRRQSRKFRHGLPFHFFWPLWPDFARLCVLPTNGVNWRRVLKPQLKGKSMPNLTQKRPTHGRKLPWNYTVAAYLYFITLSATVTLVLPLTSHSLKRGTAFSDKPFVSMLERGSAVHDLSKVTSAHRMPWSGHGAL